MFDFTGKTVVVNGGTAGIGAEAVKQFAKAGAHVFFSGRDSEKAAQVLAATPRSQFIRVDNRREEEIEEMLQRVLEQAGKIDVLFNNAGVLSLGAGPLTHVKSDDWDQVVSVNQTAYYLYMKHALKAMMKQRAGTIVNNAAILGGRKVNPALPAYSATKAAIIAMTESAAVRHAKQGIRINAVSPGPTKTELAVRAYGSEAVFEEKSSHHPRGRYGDPAEIAHVVLFLASPYASYVNGANIRVDGGYALV
ncbi:SDR family NAD(P)-dependent oxidoreductase [Ectobacillus ponti]|uniref:SDR family oxidoreductase n=1 Tax=Ectobacillus ponti TaxID=2961894 RepID=A0AA41X3Q6_9BACI|nr:SDR family oxidoreductase [Ectobacillus ponti]MCP8968384.1 SDR family oxidoreductase [Ectobacillus ponti]